MNNPGDVELKQKGEIRANYIQIMSSTMTS